MSRPEPVIVQTPPLSESPPAMGGVPMSAPLQVGTDDPQVTIDCVENAPTVVTDAATMSVPAAASEVNEACP